VFVGTTNDLHYLHDPTGARRFWPVKIGYVDRASLIANRDQLFAEAVQAFESGSVGSDLDRPIRTRWWPSPDLEKTLVEEQEARQETDAWEPIVAQWLSEKVDPPCDENDPHYDPKNRPPPVLRDAVTTGDILLLALGFKADRCDRDSQSRVGKILRKLNWTPIQQREHGLRVRRYERPKSYG
jgi:predicted P-loop ATPase